MWKDAGGERADGVFFVRLDCLCLGGWGSQEDGLKKGREKKEKVLDWI